MEGLVERIVRLAEALDETQVPWAFGGAIALAYATEEPRGTRDLDLNLFLPVEEVRRAFRALPTEVRHAETDVRAVQRDGQVRLWWGDTPVDLFFAVAPFHDDVAARCRRVPFAGREISILSAEDLAVFKAMFDRPKDWVDIAAMVEAAGLDPRLAAERLATVLGADPRVDRLRSMGPGRLRG